MPNISPLGPFAPITPVPVDETRDWGDVKEDVLRLIEAWQRLADLLTDGSVLLGAIKQATEAIEELDKALGITWHKTMPDGELVAEADTPRRWRYRVC